MDLNDPLWTKGRTAGRGQAKAPPRLASQQQKTSHKIRTQQFCKTNWQPVSTPQQTASLSLPHRAQVPTTTPKRPITVHTHHLILRLRHVEPPGLSLLYVGKDRKCHISLAF
jgi:hypothetical protein